MQDFPANSQRARAKAEPRKKIDPVTSAAAVRRKKGLGRRFKDTFIGGDAKTAADHVFFGVMIPAVKDMLYDAFDSGMRSLIFGDSRPHRPAPRPGGYDAVGPRVNYNRASQSAPPSTPRHLSRTARARHDFDQLLIPTHQEANEVLDRMFDILSRDGVVLLADLYELTGIQSSHTDLKWGWYGLPGAKAVPHRQGGYLLDIPQPEPLD